MVSAPFTAALEQQSQLLHSCVVLAAVYGVEGISGMPVIDFKQTSFTDSNRDRCAVRGWL